MINIFVQRNFILPLAFILGFSFPQLAQMTQPLIIPAMIVVMTVSIAQIPTYEIIKWKNLARPLAIGVFFNYLILSSLLLALSHFIHFDESTRAGMILVASAPPGIAVLPFTSLLSGDSVLSLLAIFGSYLSSFIIMPGLIWFLIGTVSFPVSKLVIALIELIVLPIILSRLLIIKNLHKWISDKKGIIVNWGFFFVFLSVTGLNRNAFFEISNSLLKVFLIAFTSTFFVFFFMSRFLKKIGINQEEVISMVLLSTIKNSAFSAAMALILFDKNVSIPSAIFTLVYAFYMIWLGIQRLK